MLHTFGIGVRYNVIKKKIEILAPGVTATVDNADNVNMTHIVSLAAKCGLSTGLVPSFVQAIADENPYNPVAEWIGSKAWDGTERLDDVYNTVVVRDDYPIEFRNTLIRKWLLSGVAAAFKLRGFKSRGVLTLQGEQGIGKTSWGLALISDQMLRETVVKVDHHMDGGNKDSLIGAITHFIVEIGELDSSFRKDIARLKGFLTSDSDKVRRPYGRTEAEYPRRTIFLATVNDSSFLVDTTGNSRWWTIEVESLNYGHDIDMQQVFAQLLSYFERGDEWWLTAEEERSLAVVNSRHRAVSVIRELVIGAIDLSPRGALKPKALTCTEVLQELGIERPSNPQAKECGGVLRELLGPSSRINGREKWRVPLRSKDSSGARTEPDDDRFD